MGLSPKFGFTGDANTPYGLVLAREQELDFEIANAGFFYGHERLSLHAILKNIAGRTSSLRS